MTWAEKTWTGWGRALAASGELARPERQSALAAIASEAPAIGNCRSYGDACLNDQGRAVLTTRLDRILDFDTETGLLHAEAGSTLGDLTATFAPRGWLPPVLPGTGFATLGGAIAMDVHGKNHHHAGTFGNHVTAITLASGETLEPGTSRFAATVGGLGQTGAIASARVQMLKAKGDVMLVTERRAGDWEDHLRLLSESEATYTVGWLDATATGPNLGRGIVEEGETGAGIVTKRRKTRSVPFNAPGFALSAPVVRLFNRLYYNRVPAAGRTSVKPITDFFFPLDKIHNWNRLYGRHGFHQFQCVVPPGGADQLRDMLDRIARSGLASPLAVLKRLGQRSAGLLSFPMDGWTLAVDFPNRDAARRLISDLEAATLEAEGRIYLAKDALARPATIHAMYDALSEWRAQAAEADPEGRMKTDLVRRLELRP